MEYLVDLGLLGLFILSFLAATVLPIGSETVLSGVLLTGEFNFFWVIAIASLGNWLGAMAGYYLGYIGKWEWLEKYFKIKQEKVIRFKDRVVKHGSLLALICWLPAIGDFIAIALGLFKVSWKQVAIYMFIGKAMRFLVWGYLTVWVWERI